MTNKEANIRIKDRPNKVRAKLIIDVEGEFYDDESTAETLRYCVEQDLEDAGFNVIDSEVFELANKVSEQQPCEDCISRTELLSRIDAERKHLLDLKMDGAEHIIVHHARRIIEEMPSVTPKTDVLDKIRAEIELHRRKTEGIDPYDLVGDCLDIIDRYKKESEDDKNDK